MDGATIYILVSIIVIAVVAYLVLRVWKIKKDQRLSAIAGLAFGFVLAGLIFGEDRLAGYGLMAVGVLLALVDLLKWQRTKK
jgi:hypothetical protein